MSQRSRTGLLGLAFFLPFIVLARSAVAQLAPANTSAFGESIAISLVPLSGPPLTVTSGPLPSVAEGYGLNKGMSNFKVAGVLGNVLETSLLQVSSSSQRLPASPALADSTVGGLKLQLIGSPFLVLKADAASSRALISCMLKQPVPTGSVNLANAQLNGVPLGDRPAPNTVLLDTGKLRVVLNEQILSGGNGTAHLVVNAIHISIQKLSITGVGVLTGEIILGQSHAYLPSCT